MASLLDRAMGKLARPGRTVQVIQDVTKRGSVQGRSQTDIYGGRRVSGIIRDASDAFARAEGDEFSWDDPNTWEYPPQGVRSSNLSTVAYDSPHKLMQISFTSGAIYNYRTIPESEYHGLMNASSKGRYHYHRIRCSFPYEEITRLAKTRDCGNRRGLSMNKPGRKTIEMWGGTPKRRARAKV